MVETVWDREHCPVCDRPVERGEIFEVDYEEKICPHGGPARGSR